MIWVCYRLRTESHKHMYKTYIKYGHPEKSIPKIWLVRAASGEGILIFTNCQNNRPRNLTRREVTLQEKLCVMIFSNFSYFFKQFYEPQHLAPDRSSGVTFFWKSFFQVWTSSIIGMSTRLKSDSSIQLCPFYMRQEKLVTFFSTPLIFFLFGLFFPIHWIKKSKLSARVLAC